MKDCQSITSSANPLLQKLRKQAADPVAYRKSGNVWIEGDHLCEAALLAGVTPPIALIADTLWTGDGGSASASDAAAARLSAIAMKADHVLVIPARRWQDFSALPAPVCVGFVLPWTSDETLSPRLNTLVLDRVQDAGNVGTMLRTACAFGVQQVVALKGTAGLWSPKVLRAGMGAHWSLKLVEQVDAQALAGLDIPVWGTSGQGQYALHEAPIALPCAWIVGHEGQGVDPQLLASCQGTVRIPQPGGQESLNVAIAAAVCMYEVYARAT